MSLRHLFEKYWIRDLEAIAETSHSHLTLNKNDLIGFRQRLTDGEPIVIWDVFDKSSGISLDPMEISEFCKYGMSKLNVTYCKIRVKVNILAHTKQLQSNMLSYRLRPSDKGKRFGS
ncbi:hypothetical protein L1887_12486 [Cichorium endivia]|nr:hypothetical protein L1887_12486 [Cichorium endivia]